MELTNTSDLKDQRVVSWVDAKFYSCEIVWWNKSRKYIVTVQFNRRSLLFIIIIIIIIVISEIYNCTFKNTNKVSIIMTVKTMKSF